MFASLQSTLDFALVYGLFALSTYTAFSVGLLSVASVTFGALGGFVYADLSANNGVPLILALLIALVIGALAATLMSFVLLRLASDYFAVATIALVLITQIIVLNIDFTGGALGKVVIRQGSTIYLFVVVFVVAFVLARLGRSRYGLAAEAVREDPDVAATLGVSVMSIRRTGFALSGAIAGMAGVLMADTVQYINAQTFYIDLAFNMLAAVVLGGAYNWLGPIIGALIFRFLPQILQSSLGTYQQFVTGVILVLIMIFMPRGVIDFARMRQWTHALGVGRRLRAVAR